MQRSEAANQQQVRHLARRWRVFCCLLAYGGGSAPRSAKPPDRSRLFCPVKLLGLTPEQTRSKKQRRERWASQSIYPLAPRPASLIGGLFYCRKQATAHSMITFMRDWIGFAITVYSNLPNGIPASAVIATMLLVAYAAGRSRSSRSRERYRSLKIGKIEWESFARDTHQS